MKLRPEQPGDAGAIHDLTRQAFAPKRFSDGSEAAAIDGLRRDGDLTLSLVAVDGAAILGHIAFSPVTIGDATRWFGLGPVAVRPDRQRTGIGSALIRTGLAQLDARGASGCALIGDPAYYGRFGFQSDGGLTYRDLPGRLVQWIAFGKTRPQGELRFAPALEA